MNEFYFETNVNISSALYTFKRLQSGQETLNLKKCQCMTKITPLSSLPNRYYNETLPRERDFAVKRDNGQSEDWPKVALTDGDERSGVFGPCGGIVNNDVDATNLTTVGNRLEFAPESTTRPSEPEHYPVYLDGTDNGGFTRSKESVQGGRSQKSIRPQSDHGVSRPKENLNVNKNEKKLRKVKRGGRKRTKNKCICTRVVRAEESNTNVNTTMNETQSQAVYPGINCGHKNCLTQPIITPKYMGWLWSLRETGGVKINRNWRPGAIPTNVKLIMDRVRGVNTDDIDSYNLTAIPHTFHTDQNHSSDWSGTTVDSNKKYRRSRRTTILSDSQRILQLQNNNNANTTNEEPIFSMNKHNGQYGFQMNPMPYKDQNGELVYPKNIEPVQIKLGQRSGRNTAISSQSSIDIDLIPQHGLNRPK